MLKRTPLYQEHVNAKAQLVDFCGWEMPLNYGSQLLEHRHVRNSFGLFDVSHMCVVDVVGDDAFYFLHSLLANDVRKLKTPGSAFYTCMLNHSGGILDDMIVYRLNEEDFRLVVNSGSGAKILDWLNQHGERYNVYLSDRDELAILALQGPDAINFLNKTIKSPEFAAKLGSARPFSFFEFDSMFVARTGYTGEDGVEIILPGADAVTLWRNLIKQGVVPCGLGARDSLRLEAGLNLYSADMTEKTTPLESNLAWTVSWEDPERMFVGKQALESQLANGIPTQLVGVVMLEPGVLRAKQKVFLEGDIEGEITSGGFSPVLGHSIALARVPRMNLNSATVERRGKKFPVSLVKPPFVRGGQKHYKGV